MRVAVWALVAWEIAVACPFRGTVATGRSPGRCGQIGSLGEPKLISDGWSPRAGLRFLNAPSEVSSDYAETVSIDSLVVVRSCRANSLIRAFRPRARFSARIFVHLFHFLSIFYFSFITKRAKFKRQVGVPFGGFLIKYKLARSSRISNSNLCFSESVIDASPIITENRQKQYLLNWFSLVKSSHSWRLFERSRIHLDLLLPFHAKYCHSEWLVIVPGKLISRLIFGIRPNLQNLKLWTVGAISSFEKKNLSTIQKMRNGSLKMT